MLDELTELYHLEIHKYLDQLSKEAVELIGSIAREVQTAGGTSGRVTSQIDQLEDTLKQWDQIAEPMHILMQSRGTEDESSLDLASKIRELGVYIANEYRLFPEAKRLTKLMKDVFAELPRLSESIGEDIKSLDKNPVRRSPGPEEG